MRMRTIVIVGVVLLVIAAGLQLAGYGPFGALVGIVLGAASMLRGRTAPDPAAVQAKADDAATKKGDDGRKAADDRAAALSRESRLKVGADWIEEERAREARRTPK